MWAAIWLLGKTVAPRWPVMAGAAGVVGVGVGALWVLWFRLRMRAEQRRRERRRDEELAAYAQVDMRLPADGDPVELAARVSQAMAENSAFPRAAMLVRQADGQLKVVASAGMDGSTVQALAAFGQNTVEAERKRGLALRRGHGGLGACVGSRSFAVILGERVGKIGCGGAIVIPLWTTGGRMLGALAVGADGFMSVRRSVLGKALEPLEALAFKVERTIENAALAERLLRAEKLAGLGLIASGMAHALNNPLTAVLGFAELIADTTGESRVKEDAEIIVREAQRMRQTVETLLEFWRPGAESDGLVPMAALVQELASACAETLESRGVRLIVTTGDEPAVVRGKRDRLRQMMEHLMNHAAQAVAGAGGATTGLKEGEEQVIRVSVSVDGEAVHVVVSDTGPGFVDPGRVFELSGTMREASDGAGLGLSVCYGIAHEHGGEISAFNLHPHGGAVAVELSRADFAVKKSVVEEVERASV